LEQDLSKGFMKVSDIIDKPIINLNYDQAKTIIDGKILSLENYSGEFLLCYDGKEFCFANLFNGKIENKIFLYEGEL